MTIWLPVMLLVSSVAVTGMCFGNKERRGICRVFVSGGCIGALLTYLLWRFDSVVVSFGDVAPAAIAFSVLLLILETVNGIDHGVYLLIKSRKARTVPRKPIAWKRSCVRRTRPLFPGSTS